MAQYKKRKHRHPRGHWCNCPWGSAQLNDPIDDLWDAERYGSTEKVAWVKESAKLDWLRDRPDMQEPHHQRFLDHLEANYGAHDNLFPWLARERKKGRLEHHTEGEYDWGLRFNDHKGRRTELDPDDHLQTIQDWMKYKKQAKQGVDIMQHHIGDAVQEADKWDGGGEIVHQIEDPSYNGWTVRRLRNKRDMRKEGDRMNHCVGSNGMPYIPRQERGESEFFSLRDEDNQPHATMELNNHRGGTRHEGLNPNNPLGSEGWSAGEYYGPNDEPVPWEHDQLMHEFFHPRGIYPEPSAGHEDEEEPFEPWWDEYYQIDGPSSENDWISHHNGDYEEENTPDEYDRAQRDAYDNELDGPELYVGDPDIKDIWDDFEWNHTRQPVDPHRVKEMFDSMKDHGYEDEWREYAKDWLDENYNQYLDPYGTDPEWNPNRQDQFADPHAPPQGPGRMQAPAVPGSYYPGRANPNDEHFARNLEYHLNQYTDPTTGEPITQHQNEQMYPAQEAGHDPQYRIDTQKSEPPRRNWREPDWQRAQQAIDDGPPGRNRGVVAPRSGENPEEEWQNSDLFKNRQEREKVDNLPHPFRGDPETWEQGGTTNWHQIAVPGLEDQAPNPGHVNQYFRGEPQGRIFPKNWYFDRSKGYGAQTDLPPHLFPPERYTWTENQPHPQQLPMWSAASAEVPGNPTFDRATGQYDFENREPRYVPTPEGQSWDLTRGEVAPAQLSPEQQRYRYNFPGRSDVRPGEHPTVPIQASYHPRDDEEWVDEDEPDFSATIPEPRWTSN